MDILGSVAILEKVKADSQDLVAILEKVKVDSQDLVAILDTVVIVEHKVQLDPAEETVAIADSVVSAVLRDQPVLVVDKVDLVDILALADILDLVDIAA